MTAHVPALKSAMIFSYVSNVMTTLGLLSVLTDCTNMATEFIITIKK